MSEALTLFDPIVEVTNARRLPLSERFAEFHARNPHVFAAIVAVADEWAAAGGTEIGMGAIFERLRWQTGIETSGNPWKLDNSLRSRYTRLVMEQRPDLAHLFHVRELRAA